MGGFCILLLFGLSVMSDSLWLHGLQHTSLPCPSLSPRVSSNSCPFSQWCYPTITSSVIPFSSSLQSFPASGSFPVSRLFATSGQSNGASASASVLPVNIQDWFPLGFPAGSEVKVSAWNVGDPGSISGLGRSPGEGNGNPLQYSCLENPM